jgi:tetratricopeptide (TPR) repeat protein
MVQMLSEEALILAAALVACGLLLLGVMELLWPSRRRQPALRRPDLALRRRASVRPERLARRVLESGATESVRTVPSPAHASLLPMQLPLPVPDDGVVVPAAAVAELDSELIESPAAAVGAASVDDGEWSMSQFEAPAAEPAYESVLAECEDLYRQRRYAQVVTLGTGALLDDGEVRVRGDASESAALWRVVALAHRDLGEDAESRGAAEAAFAVAPESERSVYAGQLVTLAATASHALLSEVEGLTSVQTEARLALVCEAVAWLESALAVSPGDEDLQEQAGGARALLWSAYERAALTLVHRQEFRGARRLLREAIAREHFPAARTDVFRELFTGTFSGEIGQLTAKAIRSMHAARESDALAALRRAETLLDNLGDDMLSPSRREEVDGRLWWGYNRLGERRVAAGEYEIALDPLFHALEYDAGPARHEETRALLVRALEGVADVRALAIRELAAAGDHDAAVLQCNTLWTTLRTATESGLSRHELAGVFSRAQRLFDSLERTRD